MPRTSYCSKSWGRTHSYDLTILEHVADAGRCSGVVLEDQVASIGIADQVGAADVDVDIFGDLGSHELPPDVSPKMRAGSMTLSLRMN